MATRNLVINDPVGIHARPAAMFAQAVTASGHNAEAVADNLANILVNAE